MLDWSSTIQVRSVLLWPPHVHNPNLVFFPERPYGFNVPYRVLFRRFESIMMKYGGRPHWAKAHSLRPDTLRTLYPRFDDFCRLLGEVDPSGTFRNEYISRHIFGLVGTQYDERVFKDRP